MDDAKMFAGDASSKDPEVGLRAVAALRRLLERLEALQVSNARDHDWTWQEIAEALGVSKQAVHKKYGADVLPARLKDSMEAVRNFLAERND